MDQRDIENTCGKWYESFNKTKMEFVIYFCNEHDEEHELTLPAIWDVCSLCEGEGSHVNPSIDSHGLSADDFAEDPDFAEDYFRGTYDVPCYRCNGRTTEPIVDQENLSDEQKQAYEVVMTSFYERVREYSYQERFAY